MAMFVSLCMAMSSCIWLRIAMMTIYGYVWL